MIDATIEKVRRWADGAYGRRALLAREAKVHRNTLKNMASPDWYPRTRILLALNDAVDRLERAEAARPTPPQE